MNRLPAVVFVSVFSMTPLLTAQSSQVTQSAVPAPEQTAPPPKPDPEHYLAEAQQRLGAVIAIPPSSDAKKNADAKKKVAQLGADLTKLRASYRMRATPNPNAAGETPDPGFVDWNMKFSDVERDVALILGGDLSVGETATTDGGTASVAALNAQPVVRDPSAPQPVSTSVPVAQGGGTAATSQVPAGSAPSLSGTPLGHTGDESVGSSGVASGAFNALTVTPTASAARSTMTTSRTSGTAAGGNGAANGAKAGNGRVGRAEAPDIGVTHLDPRVRAALEQMRTSIELFYDAAIRADAP